MVTVWNHFFERSSVAHCLFHSVARTACLRASRPGFRNSSRRSWNGLRYCVSLFLEIPQWGESHRRTVRTAAGTGNTVTPVNLLQQVRCGRFRPKHIERHHSCWPPLTRCPCPLRLHSYRSVVSTISYPRALAFNLLMSEPHL